MKKILIVTIISIILFTTSTHKAFCKSNIFSQNNESELNTNDYKNKQKDIKNELFAINGFILLVGVTQWDWGSGDFEFKDEGYFQKNTKYGGADKIGHFYSTYLLSDLFTKSLIKNGWERKKASSYSTVYSFLTTLMIEIGDGTSKDFGFSYEDQLFNTLGALVSYLLINNPSLDKKIDIRLEYFPSPESFASDGNLLDDYENMRYFLALKLDGFEKLKRTPLRFFELQTSYKVRGYEENLSTKSRDISFGIGINISKILDYFTGNKTNSYVRGTFDYYQLPYTYIHYEKDLNE